jgi:propionyl-CoA carboxylase beta chain
VEIIFKKDIESAAEKEEVEAKLISDYTAKFANPYIAAERGYIDEIIEPSRTRPKLIRAFEMLESKVDTNPKKKHGNIPL